eukprot:XP_014774984.1 PREDICTED: NACHT and WD repeat domain-containing protein 2-like [Octopus bimaculoides]
MARSTGIVSSTNENRNLTVEEISPTEKGNLKSILSGRLDNLPTLPSSIVRIFLSSTFKAKNCNFQQALYPDQKLRELDGFIGSRYGYRPLPYTIEEQHFDHILQEANAIDSDNIDLLNKWYIKDTNAVPPVYVLQPIRSVFQHYMSRDPNMAEQQAKDTQGWKECERSLLDLIRRASDAAYQNSLLTQEQKHDFFASVTESEIIKGIFQVENPSAKTLVYLRKFTDFPESLDGDDIGGEIGQEGNMVDDSPTIYVDVVEINKKKQVDEEARELLENCIARLESEKMITNAFDVIWLPGGIDLGEYHEPHQEYISEFCEAFKSDMINLIQRALDDQNRISEDYLSYYEILHHLHFCVQKCALFCGQQDTLEKIQQITKENNSRKPIVIHAPSGVGKTSLLAMIMKQLPSWFSDNYLAVIRFLGTTPETCNIYNVLLSVMKQLSSTAGMILEPMGYADMNRLEKYFPRFLRQFGQSIKKPVFILLDSLDQLSEDDDAFSMTWLPDFLPTNVRVIVSTLPQTKIMKNLVNRLQRDDCFIEVPLMSETIGEEVLRKFLNMKKRTITDSQKEQLLAKFSKVSSPLYLKLLLHDASQWLSYQDIDFEQLPDSVNSAIEQHFENLERKFGKTLVQFALGYLTISLNGLTELELIDALSCNNEVLNAIFEMNDPPSRKIINLPPFLWARVYHDIRDYLTDRFSHGKSTFFWYHRQFIEAATRRYTQNEENLHADLAEIFACESNIKKDLILQQRNWVIYDADRNITPQILNFENKRKLECITYHICRAGDFINTKDVKENVFCNIHFLFTKISVFSQDHIIQEIKDFLTKRPDRDIQVILELLQDINEEIQSLEQLSFLILANLPKTNNGSSLTRLIEKSEQILYSSNRKMLIPTCNCLKNRNNESITDSELVFTFPNYSSIIENKDGIILLEKRASEKMSPFAVILTNGCIELTRLNHGQIRSFIPTTDGDKVYLLATERMGSLNSNTMKIRWQNDDILKNYGTPYLCSWTKDGSYLAIAFDSDQIALFYVRENKLRMSTAFNVKEGLVFNNLRLVYYAEALSVFASSTNGELVEYSKLDNNNPSTKQKQLFSTISSLQMSNNDELIILKISDEQTVLCSLLTETFQETGKYKFDGESTDFEICSSSALLAVLKDKNKISILDAFNYLESQIIKVPCPTITCFAMKWSKHQVLASYMDTLIIFDYSNEIILFQLESHSDPIKCLALSDNFVVTIDTNFILKLWDFTKVNSSDKTPYANRCVTEEEDVISFTMNQKAATIVTGSQHNQINEWDSKGFLLKSFKINLRPQEMHLINDKYLLAYEKSKGKLEIYDFETTEIHLAFKDMYILAITTYQSFEEILLYTVNDHKNYLTVAVSDISKKKFMMEIPILKDFEFTSLEVSLTPLGSYILFKCGVTDSDYKDIEQEWKTKGGFSPQPYPYRFAALKLDSGNGILKQCFRQLTDIPTLGRTASPLQGNQIMIVSGRAVVIWDIFIGKCDEAIAKSAYRKSKFRRYLNSDDQNCEGLCLERSINSKYVTIGYADGFVIIYRTGNGRPMIENLPETKHEASVNQVTISHNNKWVASACANGVIKLWKTKNNSEFFSMQLRSSCCRMQFSLDFKYFVVLTTTNDICIFNVHTKAEIKN